MKRYPLPIALLVVALLPSAVMSQTDTSQPADQTAPPATARVLVLPDGEGRDVLIQLCSQCHSPNIVAGEYHTRDEWRNIIETMANGTNKQNDQIENYLVTAFPSAGAADAPTKQ